jgi:dienelactone hydrolase
MKKLTLLMLSSLMLSGLGARAEIKTETITYKQGDTTLEGYLAYDAKLAAKRPGILVMHEWTGIGPYVKGRVEQLAKMGYTAFAPDIYGKGVRPDQKTAGEVSTKYKNDRALTRQRAEAGLEQLKKHKTVDPAKLAVMGYCFGGMVALELARAGADVKGVVTFHGSLDTPKPEDAKNIKGKVLALHGADDPYVKEDAVKGFENEMRAAGVDWELVKYSKAVHAFTNPEAGNDNSKGAAYNAEADRRSWQAMKDFFAEIFGGGKS